MRIQHLNVEIDSMEARILLMYFVPCSLCKSSNAFINWFYLEFLLSLFDEANCRPVFIRDPSNGFVLYYL